MYKCNKCNFIFKDVEMGECDTFLAYHGETAVYETQECCPKCGSANIFEMYYCKECKQYVDSELLYGFCKNCLDNVSAKDCFEISKRFDKKKEVQLNSFIFEMFMAEEMEDILLEALVKCGANTSKYVDGDREWFAENLKELKEVRK